jgi:hypothetical protein
MKTEVIIFYPAGPDRETVVTLIRDLLKRGYKLISDVSSGQGHIVYIFQM